MRITQGEGILSTTQSSRSGRSLNGNGGPTSFSAFSLSAAATCPLQGEVTALARKVGLLYPSPELSCAATVMPAVPPPTMTIWW